VTGPGDTGHSLRPGRECVGELTRRREPVGGYLGERGEDGLFDSDGHLRPGRRKARHGIQGLAG